MKSKCGIYQTKEQRLEPAGTEDSACQRSRVLLLSILLYACETWTVYQRHAKRLNHMLTQTITGQLACYGL